MAQPPRASSAATRPAGTRTPRPSETRERVTSNRDARLSAIVPVVQARREPEDEWAGAEEGQVLPVGGQVRTLEAGRATIALWEGTIVRLAPNSTFMLAALEYDRAASKGVLRLLFGKLWVILRGGEVEVQTPIGVAAVRGSFLSVEYYPERAVTRITCLEGHCELTNAGQTVQLVAGQSAEVIGADSPPSGPGPMSEAEVNGWLANNPEATLVPLPSPVPTSTGTATTVPASATSAPTRTATSPGTATSLPAPTPTTAGVGGGGGDILCFDENGNSIPCPPGLSP